MNQIRGIIQEVKSEQSLSLVRIAQGDFLFTSIVIGSPDTMPDLQVGREVTLVFKESEVVISTGELNTISMRNQIPGTIRDIDLGNLLATLTLDTRMGPITSIITRNAVEQLGLQKDLAVTALIKTNEMMLSR